MKSPLLSLVVLVSLIVSACGVEKSQSSLYDQFSGTTFYYYDRTDRLNVLADLVNEVKAKYVSLSLKQERLGIKADAIFSKAVDDENASPDPIAGTPLEQAEANMAFLDRMQSLLASFKDTHLRAKPQLKRPAILNGLLLREVDGKFFVVAMSPRILSYAGASLPDDNLQRIHLGLEVIAIDGRLPSALAEELIVYEAASSEAFGRSQAVKALTGRSYLYPEKDYSDFSFRTKAGESFTVKMAWYYDAQVNRKDAITLLKNRGIRPLKEAMLTWNDQLSQWQIERANPWQGYNGEESPEGAISVKVWHKADDPSFPAFRTGYLIRQAKAYGFIQLYTYMLDKVVAPDQSTVTWEEPFTAFISELQTNGVPLILDLRINDGGDSRLPNRILSFLGRPGETYPGITRGFRLTRSLRQMIEMLDHGNPANLNGTDSWGSAIEVVKDAVKRQADYTKMYSPQPTIATNVATKIFSPAIVVLISPYCISACDLQASLFKGSRRALLIGSHTNGTGAGFLTLPPYSRLDWLDRNSILRTEVPNILFGFGGEVGRNIYDDINGYANYSLENRPTVADVNYHDTLDDYLYSSRGWYDKAIAVLTTFSD